MIALNFKKIFVVLSLHCLLMGAVQNASAVFLVKLPIELGSTAGLLTNHTTRIVLDSSTPGFQWANSCNDITVVDSAAAPLPYFVEACDVAAQHAIVWVRVPLIPASPSTVTIEMRYADVGASSQSNALAVFTDRGFLYHTQPYAGVTPGPETRAAGDALFNYDSVTTSAGYGCTQLKTANVDNSGTFGSNADIAYHVQTVLNVKTAGNYEFRYGNDFGHGGETAIDGVPLEADWTGDLWWGFNYASPDVLIGSRNLSVDTYNLDMLGFERCCDGPAGMQYRILPAGAWKAMDVSSTDLELLAPDCPVDRVDIKVSDHMKGVDIALSKSVSDLTPSIGETVTFVLTLQNNGIFAATNVDLADMVPAGFGAVSNISNGGVLTGSQVDWLIPSLAAGGSLSVSFDAVVQ